MRIRANPNSKKRNNCFQRAWSYFIKYIQPCCRVISQFSLVLNSRDGVKEVAEYIKEFHPRLIGLTGTEEQASFPNPSFFFLLLFVFLLPFFLVLLLESLKKLRTRFIYKTRRGRRKKWEAEDLRYSINTCVFWCSTLNEIGST